MADGSIIFDTGLDNSNFKSGITAMKTAALTAAAAITAAFTAASAAAVNVGVSYTSAMSQVAATMGITRASEDYALLAASAEEMGAKTKYSATQAGEALNYLALAGYNAEKSCAALPTVLNVAAAGGIDLAYASDMITDSMSALGLGMEELESFSDKLAKTSQKSNTSVAQLGEAILTVGGTAKNLSGGVTELNTMLGLIADNGIKGSEGGTALRNIILSLSAPTDTAAEAMQRLNVTAFDSQGKMRALSDVFADFNNALAPLTDQEKTQVLNEIFNKVDLKAVNALLGTSAERFDELAGYIENSTGAAADMAKTMSDNLAGDMDAFNSALEGLDITAFSKFEQPMRKAVQSITEDISTLNEEVQSGSLSEKFDALSNSIGRFVSAIGRFATNDLLPGIISSMGAISENGNEIISVLSGIATGFVTFKTISIMVKYVINPLQEAQIQLSLLSLQAGNAAISTTALSGGLKISEIAVGLFTKKISAATVAQVAFNAVCAVNPFIWAALAAGVVVAIAKYTSSLAEATETTKEAQEAAENYSSALEEQKKQALMNTASLEADKTALKTKIDIYEQLRTQYEKTGEGEQNLVDITKEIQELSPVTISFIDEETQKYLSLADAVDDVVVAMERRHKIQNAEEEYDFAQNELPNLYEQRDLLSKDLAELEKQFKELTGLNSDDANPFNTMIGNTGGNWYKAGLLKNKIKEAQLTLLELNTSIADAESRSANALKVVHDTYLGENASAAESVNQTWSEQVSEYMRAIIKPTEEKSQQAAKIISDNMLKAQEEATSELENGFKSLDHDFAVGVISDEHKLYERKRALVAEYGNAELEDHWQYYEELYSYEKKFADEIEKTEKERLEKEKKLNEEQTEKLLASQKDSYKKQLSITTNGINSLLDVYKNKMSELESNISSYRSKLLSVGDVFSVKEYTDKNGEKTRKFTVNNLEEQMEQMRKYHDYVKRLKASGASDGLLAELTSMDIADGMQFGKYLTKMSDAEFSQINEYYKERDALADELSRELYADEAEKINTALLTAVDNALLQLPVQAQGAGQQFLSEFLTGLDLSSDDVSDKISGFVSGFSELYNESLDELDLGHGFSVALGGLNTYSMGQELARELAAGFNAEMEKGISDAVFGQFTAGIQLGGSSSAKYSDTSKEKTSTENIVFENNNHITVELDGEKIGEKTERYLAEKKRRTG